MTERHIYLTKRKRHGYIVKCVDKMPDSRRLIASVRCNRKSQTLRALKKLISAIQD